MTINNSIILSLCIPTYNRSNALKQCIESIICQKGFDSKVEIVVLDNKSTDETSTLMSNFANMYSNIKYYVNKKNIGMEKNLIEVLKFGNGRLLKLINDYTLFPPNKLAELLSIIEKNDSEEEILFFNNIDSKNTNIKLCRDLNSFFRTSTYWSTWIGTFSIWKSDFDSLEDKTEFEGLLFPHLLIFLKTFQNKKKIKIIQGKYFFDVQNIKKGGYDFFEIFIGNFIGKIIHKLYSEKKINFKTLFIIKTSFCKNFISIWLRIILSENAQSFDKKNLHILFEYFKFYPSLYFILYDIKLEQIHHKIRKFIKQYILKRHHINLC